MGWFWKLVNTNKQMLFLIFLFFLLFLFLFKNYPPSWNISDIRGDMVVHEAWRPDIKNALLKSLTFPLSSINLWTELLKPKEPTWKFLSLKCDCISRWMDMPEKYFRHFAKGDNFLQIDNCLPCFWNFKKGRFSKRKNAPAEGLSSGKLLHLNLGLWEKIRFCFCFLLLLFFFFFVVVFFVFVFFCCCCFTEWLTLRTPFSCQELFPLEVYPFPTCIWFKQYYWFSKEYKRTSYIQRYLGFDM